MNKIKGEKLIKKLKDEIHELKMFIDSSCLYFYTEDELTPEQIKEEDKDTNFHDLFNDSEEYPYDKIRKCGGVPRNVCYEYIGHSFLEGYIWMMNKMNVIILNRYSNLDDNDAEFESIIEEWKNKMNNDFRDVSDCPDDMIIFAETDEDYWYFWNDKDCSDCCIGHIDKNRCESLDDFRQRFINWWVKEEPYNKYYDLGKISGIYKL